MSDIINKNKQFNIDDQKAKKINKLIAKMIC